MTQLRIVAALAICASIQLATYLWAAKSVSVAVGAYSFCALVWCLWAFVYCLITEAEDNGSNRRP